MGVEQTVDKTCVIVGASHAGVNFAFALRGKGWEGRIILFDGDPLLPYHRPPLSKDFLTREKEMDRILLKPAQSYESKDISLQLGVWVKAIKPQEKYILLADNSQQAYDTLVLATGARPFIPPIPGIDSAKQVFPLRNAEDAQEIRACFSSLDKKEIVIIGGGFIGLEVAASLRKLGAEVTVLEREDRILSRVTNETISTYFTDLHTQQGVRICVGKDITHIKVSLGGNRIFCADGTDYYAEMVVVGTSIRVRSELAEEAGLEVKNGICVDETAQTRDTSIYAIGDCSYHYNPYYDRSHRLESVQNASEQAVVAAAVICGQEAIYDSIPWFWSHQYTAKLQMVGLMEGADEVVVRHESSTEGQLSTWYFKDDRLLAVHAVNHPKAFALGRKFISQGKKIDRNMLAEPTTELQPSLLLTE